MKLLEGYPTPQHAAAARSIVGFYNDKEGIDAVLLFCSCARGKATADSCLDIAILTKEDLSGKERYGLEETWAAFGNIDPEIVALRNVGKYSDVHLDFITGSFAPKDQEYGGPQDDFELEIGNYVAYSLPLWQNGTHFNDLKSKWLPYYDGHLRKHRLDMVRRNCLNNLQHIPLYSKRGLYFQCFDRLYSAHKELLQAVLIATCTYPIAYNKWIREQIVEMAEKPELYEALCHLLEIKSFESAEMVEKATILEELLETYASVT